MDRVEQHKYMKQHNDCVLKMIQTEIAEGRHSRVYENYCRRKREERGQAQGAVFTGQGPYDDGRGVCEKCNLKYFDADGGCPYCH